MNAIRKLESIEDAGGRYDISVWKNGNHVDGDLNICFEEAIKLAEENAADEIEAAIWYSESDYNNRELPDDYIVLWSK